ncbi:hypothetical protein AVEN_144281-1 [Araneus ventricosus]|uniref:Uncharacterized protein n=1 Tax=Araneus ventricosus TaxID=182803 RepID=A0A4Y2H6Z1_ARAVE|nr:hypothetical protein AVEN_144281-1 [Araneus ventricosus]
MKLVFPRPDLRSQQHKSILLPPRKSSPCSSLSSSEDLFQKSPRSLPSHFLFNSLVLLLGERSRKVSPTNHRQFCRWSPPLRAIIGSLPFFGPVLLSQAVSLAGDNLPFSSRPLKSRPLAPDSTPGSLCRRVNEDFPLRHLLCPVTHGVGKKTTANYLGGILGDLTVCHSCYMFLWVQAGTFQ